MDAGLHGAERQVQRRGDLFVGKVLLMAQQHHQPVMRGQRIDQPADPVLLLGVRDLLVGQECRVHDLERTIVVIVARQRGDRADPAPAQMVDAQAARDGVEPGREGPRGVVSLECPEHADEGLLRQVLGVLRRTEHAPGQREHLSLIAVDQLTVGAFIARQASSEDFGVIALVHARFSE